MNEQYIAPAMETADIALRTEICSISSGGSITISDEVGGTEAAKGRDAWTDDNGLW